MLLHGVNKRGETIAAGSSGGGVILGGIVGGMSSSLSGGGTAGAGDNTSSSPGSHHAAVHSILHQGRQNRGRSSSGRSGSRGRGWPTSKKDESGGGGGSGGGRQQRGKSIPLRLLGGGGNLRGRSQQPRTGGAGGGASSSSSRYAAAARSHSPLGSQFRHGSGGGGHRDVDDGGGGGGVRNGNNGGDSSSPTAKIESAPQDSPEAAPAAGGAKDSNDVSILSSASRTRAEPRSPGGIGSNNNAKDVDSPGTPRSSSGKKKSKSKKLWRAVRGVGRKKKDQQRQRQQQQAGGGAGGSKPQQQGKGSIESAHTAALSSSSPLSSSTSPTLSLTPSPPPPRGKYLDELTGRHLDDNDSLEIGDMDGMNHGGDDDDDDDAPWAPTMSMLLQTGQLDAIESDSDEDDDDDGDGGDDVVSLVLLGQEEEEGVGEKEEDGSRDKNTGRVSRVDSGGHHSKVNSRGHVYNFNDSGSRSTGQGVLGGGDDPASDDDGADGVDDSGGSRSRVPGSYQADDNGGDDDDDAHHSSPQGYPVDDFMETSGDADSMNKFFKQVAKSYMDNLQRNAMAHNYNDGDGDDDNVPNIMEVSCRDDQSRADESTLSKEETVYSSRRLTDDTHDRQPSPDKKFKLRSLGETIARRGRSRGRTKKDRAANNNLVVAAPPASGVEEGGETSIGGMPERKGDAPVTSSAQNSASAPPPQNDSPPSRRSRSLMRILRGNGATRTSSSQPRGDQRRGAEPQIRGTSLIGGSGRYEHAAGEASERTPRDAISLPRKISQTTPSTGAALSFMEDSRNSLLEDSRSSLEHSGLSSPPRKRRRNKRCLVCRKKIPRGESQRHMDFFFCSGGCFRCTSCRKLLSSSGEGEGNDNNGLQIISSARGTVLQCGGCAKSIMGEPAARQQPIDPQASEDEVDDEINERSIHLDDSEREEEDGGDGDADPSSPVSSGASGDHADIMSRAAKRLAKKASVTLTLIAPSGRSSENEQLASLSFMPNEDDCQSIHKNRPLANDRVIYELDSDVVGNPNYDGFDCSCSDFGAPRMTSVAMPKLESDVMDGTISSRLEVDFEWVDDDECSRSGSSVENAIHPKRVSPAVLSIEQFRSATMKETVMKVLRQTWVHEENHVIYEFKFVVPFEKLYISWEIERGDVLDLTQCQLEVTVTHDPPSPKEETEPELLREESGFDTNAANPISSTIHEDPIIEKDGEEDDSYGSMPNAVYVKTISIDSTISATGAPSSLILRKRGALDPDRDENDNFSELLSVASCVESIIKLPSITYVRIEKVNFECEVGLSLIEKNGATVVAEVSKSGLFANSQIKEGCEILAINGQCVRGPRSVMRIMKDVTGKILIMISSGPSPPGTRFVVKKHNSTGFGSNDLQEDITFETVNGLVRVRDVGDEGIFAQAVSKGDICLSVDGVPSTSGDVASRTLGRSQYIVAMLIFSLPNFWKSLVEYIIDEKYNRWWKKDSQCTLLWGEEDCAPINLSFDERSGRCKAEGNEENEVDLRYMNIILDRVMKLLTASINAYRTNERVRGSSRSLSVSASGTMKNRSDVYRRALIKLDEMRQNGTLTADDYEAGRHALAQVAIQTAK